MQGVELGIAENHNFHFFFFFFFKKKPIEMREFPVSSFAFILPMGVFDLSTSNIVTIVKLIPAESVH